MKRIASTCLLILLCPVIAMAQIGLGGNTSSFGRTIYVHATGSAVANGGALMAALGGPIVTGRGDPATEPVVIELGPGLYEIPCSTDVADHVSLRGSGMDATTIVCDSLGIVFEVYGDNVEISHLRILSTILPIYALTGAEVDLRQVKTEAPLGVAISEAVVRM